MAQINHPRADVKIVSGVCFKIEIAVILYAPGQFKDSPLHTRHLTRLTALLLNQLHHAISRDSVAFTSALHCRQTHVRKFFAWRRP